MFEITKLDERYFYRNFLKFRIKYYLNESKELLSRHKLLTAFIICLLAPGLNHLQTIGLPFYSIIDPEKSFKMKLMYLFPLIVFLLTQIRLQSSLIKGGTFRNFLDSINIPINVHKKIDIIVLLLSLNIVWLGIIFGWLTVYKNINGMFYYQSQCMLYFAFIISMISLLVNFLYGKSLNVLIFLILLIVIAALSILNNWVINYSLAIVCIIMSGLVIWSIKPNINTSSNRNTHFETNAFIIRGFKSFFPIELAIFRAHKLSFAIRFLFCLTISILIVFTNQTSDDKTINTVLPWILLFIETYVLSTLFIPFEKSKSDFLLFHKVFPYQKYFMQVKEIGIIWIMIMIAYSPIFIMYLHNSRVCFAFFLILLPIANKYLYTLSLRYSLFTTFIGSAFIIIIQHSLLGVYFGN